MVEHIDGIESSICKVSVKKTQTSLLVILVPVLKVKNFFAVKVLLHQAHKCKSFELGVF